MSWIPAQEHEDSVVPIKKLPCVRTWCQDALDERDEEAVVSYILSDVCHMILKSSDVNLPGAPNTLVIGNKRFARTDRMYRSDDVVPLATGCDNVTSASEVHAYDLLPDAPEQPSPVSAASEWSGNPVVDRPDLRLPYITPDKISRMRPYERLALKFTACFFSKYDPSNKLHRACYASAVRSIHESVQNARAVDLCCDAGGRCEKTFTPIRVPRIDSDLPFQTVNVLMKPDKDDPALEERYLFCAAVMPRYDMTLRSYMNLWSLFADDTLHLVIAVIELVSCVIELGHTYMDLKTANIGVWCDRKNDLTLTLIDLDDMDQGPCSFPHFSVLSGNAGVTPITDRNFMWTLAACICEIITGGRVRNLYHDKSSYDRRECMYRIIEHLTIPLNGPFPEKYGKICSNLLETLTTDSSDLFTGEKSLVDNLRQQAAMLREELHSSPPTGKRFKPSFPSPVL
ncbi:hypothetical protein CYMTET_38965 [Cymbomonas tetramitiformis]|uniref:Protein kinase domain-containing protein n=1 Tax=Cymbomonas tetramitiformis TaxID=36881 RepID=A0AAE0CCC8_9CHLO|nr:hypothetical protein CYMTET_38965 [Cymbomonas tetramitiformis]